MIQYRRLFSLLLVLALIVCLLAGCGQAAPETSGETGSAETSSAETSAPASAETSSAETEKIFYLTYGGSTSGIAQDGNMYNVWLNCMGIISSLQYRALLLNDENNAVKDVDMAKSYEVSKDGLTYTFVLKDLKWSDGTAVTASDVKWSIEACSVAGDVNTVFTSAFKYIAGYDDYKAAYDKDHSIVGKGMSGIVADDAAKTVTITLSAPYSVFLDTMGAFAILPQHGFEGLDDLANLLSYYAFWNAPIVCGMYKIDEFKEKDYVTFVPNTYYEGAPAAFSKIIMNYVTDDTLAAQDGSVDLIGSNSTDVYGTVSKLTDYTTYYADIVFARQFTYMVTGSDGTVNDKTQDVKIRQAVAYAVDWATVLKGIFGDLAKPTTTALSSASKYYAGALYTYDPAKAQSLLDEAGWTKGDTFRILYYYNDQATQDYIDAITSYLGQVGMTVEGTYTSNANQDIYVTRAFEMVYAGHSAFSPAMRFTAITTANNEFLFPAQATFGTMISALLGATTDDALSKAYKDLQQAEWDNCYRFTTYYIAYEFYLNNRITVPSDMKWGNNWYLFDWRFDEWNVAA